MRRIVQKSPYAARGTHFADIAISPQWHQWLRQARINAPTTVEQQQDIARQTLLKENARLADARWEAKAKYIEKPTPNPQPMLTDDVRVTAKRDGVETKETKRDDMPGVMSQVDNPVPVPDPKDKAKQQTGANPSNTFEPEAWTPGPVKKRQR